MGIFELCFLVLCIFEIIHNKTVKNKNCLSFQNIQGPNGFILPGPRIDNHFLNQNISENSKGERTT